VEGNHDVLRVSSENRCDGGSSWIVRQASGGACVLPCRWGTGRLGGGLVVSGLTRYVAWVVPCDPGVLCRRRDK
jgi:hypothetical protein